LNICGKVFILQLLVGNRRRLRGGLHDLRSAQLGRPRLWRLDLLLIVPALVGLLLLAVPLLVVSLLLLPWPWAPAAMARLAAVAMLLASPTALLLALIAMLSLGLLRGHGAAVMRVLRAMRWWCRWRRLEVGRGRGLCRFSRGRQRLTSRSGFLWSRRRWRRKGPRRWRTEARRAAGAKLMTDLLAAGEAHATLAWSHDGRAHANARRSAGGRRLG